MSRGPSVAAAARSALLEVLVRPHLVGALLAVNLATAWIVAAPLSGLLSAELDRNLYGEAMATGASWRWFDTVDRKHPEALGNREAWGALLGDEGLGWRELRRLSGPPLAALLAGVVLFGLNAFFQCGFLAQLYPDRRGSFAAASTHFAPPALALAFFAALSYAAAYGLLYRQAGKWLADLRADAGSEWVALSMTWGRLLLTLAALLLVKLVFDLSRVVLVDRGNWNWPWAFLVACRELALRGGRYAALYLALSLGTPLLAGLWWATAGRLAPQGWLGLGVLFLVQQVFIGARIALRLTHLAAARALYLEARRLAVRPPYKLEAP
jgi:hypothetical protein